MHEASPTCVTAEHTPVTNQAPEHSTNEAVTLESRVRFKLAIAVV